MIKTSRRSFLTGLIAAPVVVAASSLMPVRSVARLLVPPNVIYVGYPTMAHNFDTIQEAMNFLDRATLAPDQEITVQLASGCYSGFTVDQKSKNISLSPGPNTEVVIENATFVTNGQRPVITIADGELIHSAWR